MFIAMDGCDERLLTDGECGLGRARDHIVVVAANDVLFSDPMEVETPSSQREATSSCKKEGPFFGPPVPRVSAARVEGWVVRASGRLCAVPQQCQ